LKHRETEDKKMSKCLLKRYIEKW